MGRKPDRPGQRFHFCLALLVFMCGCALFDESNQRQRLRETLASAQQQLLRGDYEGSLKSFERVIAIAQSQPPADMAAYHVGLLLAHPLNPNNDRPKAINAFNRVIATYPNSVWAEQARVWIGVLNETEEAKRELAETKQLAAKSQEESERSRQAAEKSKLEVDKSRLEVDKSRQEIDKMKQMIEKSKQIDIEIEKKRRERAR